MSTAQKVFSGVCVSLTVVAAIIALFMLGGKTVQAATNYSLSSYGTYYPTGTYNLVKPAPVTTTTLVCPKGQYVIRNAWGQFICAPYDIRFSYRYGKVYYPYTKVTYTNTGSFTLGYR